MIGHAATILLIDLSGRGGNKYVPRCPFEIKEL